MSRAKTQPDADPFRQRNREIGSVLAAARQRANRTVTECAAIAVTTRRRYSAIERGESALNVAELELLMNYLQVPIYLIFQNVAKTPSAQHVVIEVHPGETQQFTVTVQSE